MSSLYLYFSLVLFFIETFFLFKLIKKFKFNSVVISYSIAFFYCNSVLIDGLFLSNRFLEVQSNFDFTIDLKSLTFLRVKILYFVFFISFYFFFIFENKKNTRENVFKINYVLFYLSCFYLTFFIFKNYGLVRPEIVKNTSFFEFILLNLSSIYWALLFINKKIDFKLLLFTFLFALYGVFSFQREPIFLILIMVLLKFKNFFSRNFIVVTFFSLIMVFVLFFWKVFYVYLIQSFDPTSFFLYLNENKILLSSIDPLPSFSLIYDFFENEPLFYDNFQFSYYYSFKDFFSSFFLSVENLTLGRAASDYYTGSQYGVAFSMMLESFLNFGYFGGIFIAFVSKISYNFVGSFSQKYSSLNEIFFIMLFTSLVRTELIVIFKIIIIPFIFCLLIVRFINFFKV